MYSASVEYTQYSSMAAREGGSSRRRVSTVVSEVVNCSTVTYRRGDGIYIKRRRLVRAHKSKCE